MLGLNFDKDSSRLVLLYFDAGSPRIVLYS